MWLFVKSSPIRSKASSLRGLRDLGNISFPWRARHHACADTLTHISEKRAYILTSNSGKCKYDPAILRQRQRLRPWMKEMCPTMFSRKVWQMRQQMRRDSMVEVFLCLIPRNGWSFLRQEEWYGTWTRDARGNNIYLDFITTTSTHVHTGV